MNCRICGSFLSRTLIDMGFQPVANRLVRPDQIDDPETRHPLKAMICDDCGLIQVKTLGIDLFSNDYPYFSSMSDTFVDHAKRFAHEIARQLSLGSSSHVIEIGANDGYLLQHFVDLGISCRGFDPATGPVSAAMRRGVPMSLLSWTSRIARLADPADLIIANNVLAHVNNVHDFVKGMHIALKPGGMIVVEVPDVSNLLRECQFDTIYHEHLSYFSPESISRLFAMEGLVVIDSHPIPTHGGSIRIYATHADGADSAVAQKTGARVDHHRLTLEGTFELRAKNIKMAFLKRILERKMRGDRIAAYGAPAKGVTFLNTCGVGADLIDYCVDITPAKQGCLMPGSRIPIVSSEALDLQPPDLIICLPWNFVDEVIRRLANVRARLYFPMLDVTARAEPA